MAESKKKTIGKRLMDALLGSDKAKEKMQDRPTAIDDEVASQTGEDARSGKHVQFDETYGKKDSGN